MKNIKKLLSSVLCTSFILCTISVNSFAQTSNIETVNKKTDAFLNSQYYKDMIKEYPNAKLKTKKDTYYRLENSKVKLDTKKAYTEDEYITERLAEITNNSASINSLSGNIGHSFDWIYVAISYYELSEDLYNVSMAYNWLTQPYYQLDDTILLGTDSNFSIITSSVQASHTTVDTDGTSNQYDYNWYDIDCVGANQYGVNVPLDSYYTTGYYTQNALGWISGQCIPANTYTTNGKYYGGYCHRQIMISDPSISFDADGLAFQLNITQSHDDACLSDVLYR